MNFEELRDPELQEKLKGANSPEELLALARENGFELSDAQLEDASGGAWFPKCEKYETVSPY